MTIFLMRTFGGFRCGDKFFYGELHGEDVHVLALPYWIQIQPTGEVLPLANVHIALPVAPSKLIAVGLNYSDHIAEMKRTPLGAPLIWFKAPSSLLPHGGAIEIAFPDHRTDFEVELAIVIGAPAKNVSAQVAPDHVITKNNLAAANHSTRTHRSDHSCMPMSISAISRLNFGKTESCDSMRARAR